MTLDNMALRKICREIDRNSDDLLHSSEGFAKKQGPMTRSQANGLLNIVNCEDNINTVISFIRKQAGKSTSRNPEIWKALKVVLESLRKQADEIQQKISIQLNSTKRQKELRDEIHILLARDYVQHLVAHMLYRSER
jgi:hypothetical protein